MKKNKNHGFSLVELLCAIVIIGLLITVAVIAISRTLENSRISGKLAQEKLLIKACESYVDDNKNMAPKAIGDSNKITLNELKNKNYLTDDIYISNKGSCMDNSYIRVYKLNNREYTYLPYLYCGNDKVKEEIIPTPDIKLLFIDDNDENNNNLIFNNINASRIYLEINGGVDDFGRAIEINTYEINISMTTKDNPSLVNYYSSGVINANRRTVYTIDQRIMEYVNANNATSINVTVIASNVLGGVSEVTSFAKDNINN